MTNLKPKPKREWEKEFDRLCESSVFGQECDCAEVKQFISQLLEKQVEEAELEGFRNGLIASKQEVDIKAKLSDTKNIKTKLNQTEEKNDCDWHKDIEGGFHCQYCCPSCIAK